MFVPDMCVVKGGTHSFLVTQYSLKSKRSLILTAAVVVRAYFLNIKLLLSPLSLITDHGSQNYMHISIARKSLLIRIQILVADHGSQIAARFLNAGKF